MKGQALLESLIVYVVIFLMSFGVIEVIRLQAFKAVFQSSVNYYAKYISLYEMKYLQKGEMNLDSNQIFKSKLINREIQNLISDDLSTLGNTLLSFDEGVRNILRHNVITDIHLLPQQTVQSSPGVHIKAYICLPVLFSSFLNRISGPEKIIIGKQINDSMQDRNCLGEFLNSKNAPKFWFRVRVASYSPWPSSTQIFHHGLGIPEKFKYIDEKQRKRILNRMDRIDFKALERFDYVSKQ